MSLWDLGGHGQWVQVTPERHNCGRDPRGLRGLGPDLPLSLCPKPVSLWCAGTQLSLETRTSTIRTKNSSNRSCRLSLGVLEFRLLPAVKVLHNSPSQKYVEF